MDRKTKGETQQLTESAVWAGLLFVQDCRDNKQKLEMKT